jgi:hypothetical protein
MTNTWCSGCVSFQSGLAEDWHEAVLRYRLGCGRGEVDGLRRCYGIDNLSVGSSQGWTYVPAAVARAPQRDPRL